MFDKSTTHPPFELASGLNYLPTPLQIYDLYRQVLNECASYMYTSNLHMLFCKFVGRIYICIIEKDISF